MVLSNKLDASMKADLKMVKKLYSTETVEMLYSIVLRNPVIHSFLIFSHIKVCTLIQLLHIVDRKFSRISVSTTLQLPDSFNKQKWRSYTDLLHEQEKYDHKPLRLHLKRRRARNSREELRRERSTTRDLLTPSREENAILKQLPRWM